MRESFIRDEDDDFVVDAIADFRIPADDEALAVLVVTTQGVSIQSMIPKETLAKALMSTALQLGPQS